MAATAPVLPQRPLQRPLARSCPPRATHRCCATAPRRGAAGPAGGPQQQQHQQPHPGPPAPRAVATTRDDILLSADERLTLQLRALPTVSADSLAAAKAAAAAHVGGAAATTTAAAAPKSAPQQPQQQQPELPTTPPGSGPFAALRARLPALSGRVKGLILLNAMTLMMGSNWVVVKANADAPNGLDSMEFMALRFLLAATLFVPFLKRDGEVAKAGLQIGFWFAGGYIAQALALAQTAASRASLLSTFTVLAVPMIAGLAGERIRPLVWGCALAALVGTGMLEEGSSLGPPNVGDAWAIASAMCFAAQMFVSERAITRLPPKSELPLMAASMLTVATLSSTAVVAAHAHDLPAAAGAVGGLLHDWQAALPAALGGGAHVDPAVAAEAATTFQQLFYTAFVSTDLLLFVELLALQSVSATDAALIYSLEPVAGALMAYMFLGERWGAWGWAGGAVILAASMLTQLSGAKSEHGGGGCEGGGAQAEAVAGAGAERQ